MKNRKLVTAWDVLISFKDALNLEKMRRCEDEL